VALNHADKRTFAGAEASWLGLLARSARDRAVLRVERNNLRTRTAPTHRRGACAPRQSRAPHLPSIATHRSIARVPAGGVRVCRRAHSRSRVPPQTPTRSHTTNPSGSKPARAPVTILTRMTRPPRTPPRNASAQTLSLRWAAAAAARLRAMPRIPASLSIGALASSSSASARPSSSSPSS